MFHTLLVELEERIVELAGSGFGETGDKDVASFIVNHHASRDGSMVDNIALDLAVNEIRRAFALDAEGDGAVARAADKANDGRGVLVIPAPETRWSRHT